MRRWLKHICRSLVAIALSAAAIPGFGQDVIKLGYIPQVHDAADFAVGRELGQKYKIEYVKFLRYSDAEIALARGDIQIAPLGYATVVGSALRDAEPKYFFIAGMSRGAINVVCRKDVQVKDWPDLKGKVFGVLTGGPAELFFDDALKTHGLKATDVDRVSFTAPGPPLLQAMQGKNIQCMAVYEPFAATAVVDGYGSYAPVDLADNSFLGINHAMAVNAEFLKRTRNLANRSPASSSVPPTNTTATKPSGSPTSSSAPTSVRRSSRRVWSMSCWTGTSISIERKSSQRR